MDPYRQPRPTVVPADPFNPRADAEVLRKAMKGFGTDEKSIIRVLSSRSNAQRLNIAFEFKTLYGKDLDEDLQSECTGHFEEVVLALMTPLPQYYAKELHKAISQMGTDEDTLIEVLCTMSNHEIGIIQDTYASMYRTSLVDDISGDTSGSFRRLLMSLCCANRNESYDIDADRARTDAQALLRAGELRLGTDESTFNAVLCQRSFSQLAATFREYESVTGHPFEKAIKNEFSGDIKDGLLAIVKSVTSRAEFFAERLHKSMAGLGTTDHQLIRIIVTRSEVDMEDIKEAFEAKYGKSLQSWIEGDTSGHYKKCLLALIGCYKP
ncbi:annexin B11-like isoform X2 [Arctopsyche grandis]|uniref:annexin B11-like isoform X2 n=1 Tax=Arctopsyche grandis TaxID=121162 RepID=UPI00406D75C0